MPNAVLHMVLAPSRRRKLSDDCRLCLSIWFRREVLPLDRSLTPNQKNTIYDDGRPAFDDVSQLYIDPIECIDCGACMPVCPVSAIFALDDLPEKWKQYTELNESYVKAGKFTPEEFAKHATK